LGEIGNKKIVADLSSEIDGMYGEIYLENYTPKEYKKMEKIEFD